MVGNLRSLSATVNRQRGRRVLRAASWGRDRRASQAPRGIRTRRPSPTHRHRIVMSLSPPRVSKSLSAAGQNSLIWPFALTGVSMLTQRVREYSLFGSGWRAGKGCLGRCPEPDRDEGYRRPILKTPKNTQIPAKKPRRESRLYAFTRTGQFRPCPKRLPVQVALRKNSRFLPALNALVAMLYATCV